MTTCPQEGGFTLTVAVRPQASGQQEIQVQVGEVPWSVAAQVLLVAFRLAERQSIAQEIEARQQAEEAPRLVSPLHFTPEMGMRHPWERCNGDDDALRHTR